MELLDLRKHIKLVRVGPYIFKSLVDTGSSVCTIKESVVDKYKYQTKENKIELFGFGNIGKPSAVCTKIVQALLRLDNVYAEVDFCVVPDIVQVPDVIVGRTFTEKMEIAYARVDNDLLFGWRCEEPFVTLANWKNQKAKERVKTVIMCGANQLQCAEGTQNLAVVTSVNNDIAIPGNSGQPVKLNVVINNNLSQSMQDALKSTVMSENKNNECLQKFRIECDNSEFINRNTPTLDTEINTSQNVIENISTSDVLSTVEENNKSMQDNLENDKIQSQACVSENTATSTTVSNTEKTIEDLQSDIIENEVNEPLCDSIPKSETISATYECLQTINQDTLKNIWYDKKVFWGQSRRKQAIDWSKDDEWKSCMKESKIKKIEEEQTRKKQPKRIVRMPKYLEDYDTLSDIE